MKHIMFCITLLAICFLVIFPEVSSATSQGLNSPHILFVQTDKLEEYELKTEARIFSNGKVYARTWRTNKDTRSILRYARIIDGSVIFKFVDKNGSNILEHKGKFNDQEGQNEFSIPLTDISNIAKVFIVHSKIVVTDGFRTQSGNSTSRRRLIEKRDIQVQETAPLSFKLPAFSWPPPGASATSKLPPNYIRNQIGLTTLGNVSDKIEKALDLAGYSEKSWYTVPNGFALITRIEQFNPDGTPVQGNFRWVDNKVAPSIINGIRDYLLALFTAKPGFYRVIAFIVTNTPFTQTNKIVSQDDAKAWILNGVNNLPETIRQQEFKNDFICTALVYEFKKATSDHPAVYVRSQLTGSQHLEKSNILGYLAR